MAAKPASTAGALNVALAHKTQPASSIVTVPRAAVIGASASPQAAPMAAKTAMKPASIAAAPVAAQICVPFQRAAQVAANAPAACATTGFAAMRTAVMASKTATKAPSTVVAAVAIAMTRKAAV